MIIRVVVCLNRVGGSEGSCIKAPMRRWIVRGISIMALVLYNITLDLGSGVGGMASRAVMIYMVGVLAIRGMLVVG